MSLHSKPFYHNQIRSYTQIFNKIFSNLDIIGKDGKVKPVPITHGPKEKWVRRNNDDDLTKQPAMLLPRMSYEITGMDYSFKRKTIKSGDGFCFTQNGEDYRVFSPAPWDITFNLYIQTKTLDDMYQIVEQILSRFNTVLNVNISIFKNSDLSYDIPLTILQVSPSDTYTGSLEENREIIYTISFLMPVYIFGEVFTKPLINNIQIEINDSLIEISAKINGVLIDHPPADGIFDTEVIINE